VLAGLLGLLAAGAGRSDEKLTPEERARLAKEATALNSRVVQLSREARFPEAAELAAKALQLRRMLFPKSDFPDGHPDLAISISNLGFMLKATQLVAAWLIRAERSVEQAFDTSARPCGWERRGPGRRGGTPRRRWPWDCWPAWAAGSPGR
jgi:hypothetical protein